MTSTLSIFYKKQVKIDTHMLSCLSVQGREDVLVIRYTQEKPLKYWLFLLGKPYAYMALKIILVTILRSFKVESDGELEDIRLKQDISIRAKDDMYPIMLFKRWWINKKFAKIRFFYLKCLSVITFSLQSGYAWKVDNVSQGKHHYKKCCTGEHRLSQTFHTQPENIF